MNTPKKELDSPPYVIREYCICCFDQHPHFDCPLCDNERFFEDEYTNDIEDFMVDFYRETILDPYFRKKTEEEKNQYLDEELDAYFSE